MLHFSKKRAVKKWTKIQKTDIIDLPIPGLFRIWVLQNKKEENK